MWVVFTLYRLMRRQNMDELAAWISTAVALVILALLGLLAFVLLMGLISAISGWLPSSVWWALLVLAVAWGCMHRRPAP